MDAKVNRNTQLLPARTVRNNTPATANSRAKSAASAVPHKALKAPAQSRAKTTSPSRAMPVTAHPAQHSKQAQLITLLRGKRGATISQMTTLTGWKAHTVRGVISGVLRKKLQLTVACDSLSASGENLYRIIGSTTKA